MRRPIQMLVCAATLLTGTGITCAAEWTHTLTPYLWGSAMSGSTTIGTAAGPVSADVDLSFGDILENLKIGGMLSYRGDSERWSILLDAIYMDLEADKETSAGPVTVDATAAIQQTAFEADLGYRLSERTLLFFGLRYNAIDADVRIDRSGPGAGASRSAGTDESWIDPVIGMASEFPLNPKWSVGLRGDIGGFGIGSDFAWQAIATVRWHVTPTLKVSGGYRYIDMDYSSGSGASVFGYDMTMSGPGLGVSFIF